MWLVLLVVISVSLNAEENVNAGIQTWFEQIGENGCNALCVVKIAEKDKGREYDPIFWIQKGQSMTTYNGKPVIDKDFTVNDGAALLSAITGDKWKVRYEPPEYVCKEGEYEVDWWKWIVRHARLPDWDSLVDSLSVKNGKIVEKRIYYKVG